MSLSDLGKKFSWCFLVFGLIMILAGVFLLCKPLVATKTVIIIIGAWFILSGILHFAAYAKMDNLVPGIGFIMLQGILDILLGLIFILSWNSVAGSIPFFLGFWMLFNGVFRIPAAFNEKKLGSSSWWVVLLYGILLIISGYYAFAFPILSAWAAITVLAAYLIVEGVSAVIEFFSVRKICDQLGTNELTDL